MTSWVKDHFRDSKHAMTTIAVGAFAAGLVGFLFVVGGVVLSR